MKNEREDIYFRGVFNQQKRPTWWKKNGTLSSAAFKSSNGVSVIKKNDQDEAYVYSVLKKVIYADYAFSVTSKIIDEVCVFVEVAPSSLSECHCNLWKNSEKEDISNHQAKRLSEEAKPAYPHIRYPIVMIYQ